VDTSSPSRATLGLFARRPMLKPGALCLLRAPPFVYVELPRVCAQPARFHGNPPRVFAAPPGLCAEPPEERVERRKFRGERRNLRGQPPDERLETPCAFVGPLWALVERLSAPGRASLSALRAPLQEFCDAPSASSSSRRSRPAARALRWAALRARGAAPPVPRASLVRDHSRSPRLPGGCPKDRSAALDFFLLPRRTEGGATRFSGGPARSSSLSPRARSGSPFASGVAGAFGRSREHARSRARRSAGGAARFTRQKDKKDKKDKKDEGDPVARIAFV
jgi:hypothetical protein